MTITIRSVFEEDGNLYPQVFQHDTLYELNIQIFCYNFFLYIKMSECADLNYYQKKNQICDTK